MNNLLSSCCQAENSALLLANESQREAYERCLDEVANHVVQALLNQKVICNKQPTIDKTQF